MNKYIQIYLVILLLSIMFSCKGQEKADQPKDNISQSKQSETKQPEVDPYFTGTEDFTSLYGPNNITRNVLQDRKGNIWFATWEGIIQYDLSADQAGGKTFTNFTNKEGLRRHRVFSMLEDKNGSLWFGTIGAGIYRYDGKNFTNITTKDGLVNDGVACFLEDKNGNIWIGTQGGISKYDGTTFTNFTTEEGLTNNDVNSIVEDKNGKFWIGTRGHACVYDGKTFTKVTFGLGTPFTNVRTIMKDKKDNIWLAGSDGLWRFPPDGNQSSLTKFTKDFVGYVYEDKAGNIWTSSADSSNGNSSTWILSRYDKKSLKNEEVTPTEIKTEGGMYFGITEDKNGNIWFGTLDGVYQYNGMFFNDFKKRKIE